jgi:hypothetical protein
VLSDLRRWTGVGLERQARAVGWGLEYSTQFKVTSLQAHTNVRALNDFVIVEPSGRVRVRIAPSRNQVDQVLPSAAKYLCYIAKDWLDVLRMPHPMRTELDTLINQLVHVSNALDAPRVAL